MNIMQKLGDNIIILSSHNISNYYLINQMAKEFSVVYIVYEKQSYKKKLKLLLRRIRSLGFKKVLGQIIFLIFDLLYIKRISKSKIRKLFKNKDISIPDIPSVEVDSINDSEVQKLLSDIKPKVVVVSGTSILRPHILSLVKTFINIHTGITPAYRGVHGGFWALYKGDFYNIGVTVHLLDRGVDTGAILYQAHVELEFLFDTFRTIPVKQYLKGAELMGKAVRDAFSENLMPVASKKGESRQWFHPTIREYWRGMRRMKKASDTI